MSIEIPKLISLACRNAYICIETLESLRGGEAVEKTYEQGLYYSTYLPRLVSFWVQFSPFNERHLSPIKLACPLLQGVRPPRGVRLAGRRAGCAHAVVVAIMTDLQHWLTEHEAFRRPALILQNTSLKLFGASCFEWEWAVERLIYAKLSPASFRHLATQKRWADPKCAKVNEVFALLADGPRFHGAAFVEALKQKGPAAYVALARELAQKVRQIKTARLRQQVGWEASRFLLQTAQIQGVSPGLGNSTTGKPSSGGPEDDLMSVAEAVKWAEKCGYDVTNIQVCRALDSGKIAGESVREGKVKRKVYKGSFAQWLLGNHKHVGADASDTDEPLANKRAEIEAEKAKASAQKRASRSLN